MSDDDNEEETIDFFGSPKRPQLRIDDDEGDESLDATSGRSRSSASRKINANNGGTAPSSKQSVNSSSGYSSNSGASSSSSSSVSISSNNPQSASASKDSLTFLSRIKKSAKAVATAATRGLGLPSVEEKKQLEDITLLGMEPKDCESIYQRFDRIATTSKDGKSKVVHTANFVMDCINVSKPTRISDAAFRALDEACTGELNKYQYAIGVWVVQNDDAVRNPKWYEWRRRIMLKSYCKDGEKDALSQSDFNDFLDDLGKAENPNLFGVAAKWQEAFLERQRGIRYEEEQQREVEQRKREVALRELFELEVKMKAAAEEYSPENLASELVLSRMQVAQQQFEHENLQKSYRDLEKQLCALKVENVNIKDHLEEMIAKVNQIVTGPKR